MSLGIPSLTYPFWVLPYFFGVSESQGVMRVRPSEFIRPNRPRFGREKEEPGTAWACEGKMAPIVEPYNSVCLIFCQEPNLSRGGPSGVGRMGLVNLP